MFKVNCIVSHKSSKERIAQCISDDIQNGVIKGGQRIDQVEISKKYKVSLSTVREALSILESKGLIEWIPGQGAFCKIYTISCFEKFMQIRRELEVLAAKEAAKNATDIEMENLNQIACRLRYLVDKNEDKAAINEQHIRFHEYLAKISGNEYLEKFITENHLITDIVNLLMEVFEVKGLSKRDYTSQTTEYSDHGKVAEVIACRNLDAIDKAVRNHLTIIIDEQRRAEYGDAPLF